MVRRSCLIASLAIAGCLLAARKDAPTDTRSEPNALALTSFESTVDYGTVTVLVPPRGRESDESYGVAINAAGAIRSFAIPAGLTVLAVVRQLACSRVLESHYLARDARAPLAQESAA